MAHQDGEDVGSFLLDTLFAVGLIGLAVVIAFGANALRVWLDIALAKWAGWL